MGVPTNERVVAMETRLGIFLEEQFPAFRESVNSQFSAVNSQFDEVKDQIAHVSPNGQTPRLIQIGKALGDPDQVESLTEMVQAHQRRKWIEAPLKSARNTFLTTLIYATTIGAVALIGGAVVHPWLHAILPSLVP